MGPARRVAGHHLPVRLRPPGRVRRHLPRGDRRDLPAGARHRPHACGRPPRRRARAPSCSRSALPYLPAGVHLAVVDPDVGAAAPRRRPRAADGRLLVGPDNGLLWPAAQAAGGVVEAVDIAQLPVPAAAGIGDLPRARHLRPGGRRAGRRRAAGRGRSRPSSRGSLVALELSQARDRDGVAARPRPLRRPLRQSRARRRPRAIWPQPALKLGARGHAHDAGRRRRTRALRPDVRRRRRPTSCWLYEDAQRRLALAVSHGDAARAAGPGGRRRAADRARHERRARSARPRLHLRVTDSTNTRARELAAAGAPHGTLVTAAEQTRRARAPGPHAGRRRPAGRCCARSCPRARRRCCRWRPGVAVAEAVGPEAQAQMAQRRARRRAQGGRDPGRGPAPGGLGGGSGSGSTSPSRPRIFPPELADRAGTLGLGPEAIEPTLARAAGRAGALAGGLRSRRCSRRFAPATRCSGRRSAGPTGRGRAAGIDATAAGCSWPHRDRRRGGAVGRRGAPGGRAGDRVGSAAPVWRRRRSAR